jgi:replicative DNA helicase
VSEDQPGRVPPHDAAAERAVLGACLLSAAAIDEALDSGLTGRDFYRPAHEAVWDAIVHQHTTREPVDAVAVADRLAKQGLLARVGGPAAVFELVDGTPVAAAAGYYARIVRERAVLRGLTVAGTKIAAIGFAAADPDESVADASRALAEVVDMRVVGRGMSLEDVADRALAAMETGVSSTPTPWDDLTDLIGGWTPGCFYAVGARPGVGKTVLAIQAAFAFANHHTDGPQVLYGTGEMTPERLYLRALATASGVDGERIRRGQLTDHELKQVLDADGRVRSLPVLIEGTSGWTASQVRARARQAHRERPVGLLVVDHIGLLRGELGRRDSGGRQAELSLAADILLETAHDLGCAVLVLTQLNRGPAQRADSRPVPTDIRDTDRIEQNADVLMLMHRDKDKAPAELSVAVPKNRDGKEGTVELTFDGPRSRITNRQWSPSGSLRAVK